MSSLFVLLLLLSIVGLIWGLIAPHHISRVTPGNKELSRKHTGFGFSALILIFFVLVGITAPPQKTVDAKQASPTAPSSSASTSKPKTQTQAPVVATQQQTETQSVPYTTQNQNDSNLAKGQTKVALAGENGTETLTYTITYTNGKQTGKTLVSTTVTTQPVNEIIDVGTYVAPAPTPTPSPTPTPTPTQSCYPLTNGGNCYEPGEYCRNSDHGATGLAGDGESITCEDNNGWRWEPS